MLIKLFTFLLIFGAVAALTAEEDLEDYDEDDRFLGVNPHDALSRDIGIQNVTVGQHGLQKAS